MHPNNPGLGFCTDSRRERTRVNAVMHLPECKQLTCTPTRLPGHKGLRVRLVVRTFLSQQVEVTILGVNRTGIACK